MIGTLGLKLPFTVSSFAVLTFKDFKHNVKGRWELHDVLGGKPRAEFLGPDVRSVSMTVHLGMNLGVWPRLMLQIIDQMVEDGDAEYLVIGGMPVTPCKLRIVSASEAWNTVYNNGILVDADVTLELEEYT